MDGHTAMVNTNCNSDNNNYAVAISLSIYNSHIVRNYWSRCTSHIKLGKKFAAKQNVVHLTDKTDVTESYILLHNSSLFVW